eukprot:TRINITY_DN13122_c2_g3_i2.p1 TRINITY_DN13122_c2_g3~~TRINITY_DN13122_c2_g3_i2.p1  ORF type:complete len:565 (+),score=125.46 TRINITY_DN13122_c2_g3_i2:1223-2917(+)
MAVGEASQCGALRATVRGAGLWHCIAVDSYLPTSPGGAPAHISHPAADVGLACSTLEKALAKLHGSYSALQRMSAGGVIAALTGAPVTSLGLDRSGEEFWRVCGAALEHDNVPLLRVAADAEKTCGLRPGAILRAADARIIAGECMLRLEETQEGDAGDWQGHWREDSPLWTPQARAEAEAGAASPPARGWWLPAEAAVAATESCQLIHTRSLAWSSAVVAGTFDGSIADTVMQIDVSGSMPFEVWAGAHQQHSCGASPADPDSAYVGLLLGVLKQKRDADAVTVIGVSNDGRYSAADSVYCHAHVRRGPCTLYVVPQVYHAAPKGYCLEVRVSDPQRVQVRFLQRQRTKGAAASGTQKLCKFSPRSTCAVTSSRPYQVRHWRKPPFDGAGQAVRWTRQAECGAKTALVLKRAPKVVPQSSGGGVRIDVRVIGGRELVSGSGSILSPYVEVKLVRAGADGEWHSRCDTIDRTRYCVGTAAPRWDQTMHFADVSSADYLFLKCFDRDLFRQEELGEILLSLQEFIEILRPGGSASVNWYPLQGRTSQGEIHLSVSMPQGEDSDAQ